MMEKHGKQQSASEDEIYLEFKVGPLHFCASVLDVVAIISPPKMIHVPLSDDIIASCFSYQNETVTVLSMHNKFGLPFTREENRTHIILVYIAEELKGFWIDKAIDIVPLGSFERNDDYCPVEGKAYSNFLTRGDEIVLQTSFQRLYECERSNMIWLANETIDDEEDVLAEIADEETNQESNASDDSPTVEVENIERPLETTAVENIAVEENVSLNQPDSRRKEVKNNLVSLDRPKTTKVDELSRNKKMASSMQSMSAPSTLAHTHDNNVSTTHKPEIKKSETGTSVNVSAVVLLLLLITGLGSIYLFDTGSDSVISQSEKIASKPYPIKTETRIETKQHAEELIEQSLPVYELSENETLNKVAQEDESIVQSSGTKRVFELHVNEKSDTNLYAITSFEPVTQQQNSKFETSTQIFTHTVVKGDTLWHITRRYLDNPHRYPELAAASHINNPHRIYPGDVIRIIVNKTK